MTARRKSRENRAAPIGRACPHCSIERRGLRRQRNYFLISCLILHSALLAQRVYHGNSDPSSISARTTLAECHRPGSVGSATGRGPAFVFKVWKQLQQTSTVPLVPACTATFFNTVKPMRAAAPANAQRCSDFLLALSPDRLAMRAPHARSPCALRPQRQGTAASSCSTRMPRAGAIQEIRKHERTGQAA